MTVEPAFVGGVSTVERIDESNLFAVLLLQDENLFLQLLLNNIQLKHSIGWRAAFFDKAWVSLRGVIISQ
jgi:hypothetical protein